MFYGVNMKGVDAMATAKKLPSGNWRVRVYLGKDITGKNIYKSFTASTKKEAEYQAAEFALHKNAKAASPHSMTLGEAMYAYCDLKEAVLSPSTMRGYKSLIKTHLLNLQKVQLDKLTRDMIQKEISRESIGRSPKTMRNVHGFLSAVLQEYYPELTLNTTLPKKEKKDIYIPTTEEVNRILQEVREKDTDLYIAVLLAALLGLRRGEICALTWNDFDWEKKELRINKSMCINDRNDYVTKAPKTYSGYRTIPVPDAAFQALSAYKQENGNVVNIMPNVITIRFSRFLDRIGIPHFTFHSLRHYNASIMLALGIPDKYAMEFMGHATNNMLKNVYQHTMDFKRKEASETINDFFNENYMTQNMTHID